MNTQERDLLQSFLREVSQSRPSHKDPLAQSMIDSALGTNPDALYLLVQRALAAEVALRGQTKLEPMHADTAVTKTSSLGSFLGSAAGVATGVVAGGFLFEGIQSVLRDIGFEENFSNGLDIPGDIADWV